MPRTVFSTSKLSLPPSHLALWSILHFGDLVNPRNEIIPMSFNSKEVRRRTERTQRLQYTGIGLRTLKLLTQPYRSLTLWLQLTGVGSQHDHHSRYLDTGRLDSRFLSCSEIGILRVHTRPILSWVFFYSECRPLNQVYSPYPGRL